MGITDGYTTIANQKTWTMFTQRAEHMTAAQVGWKHQEAVKDLEAVRKARSSDYYAAKKKLKSLKAKATATVEERQ